MADRTRRHRLVTRSRLVALGLSVAAAAGLVAGMVATAKPQPAVPAAVRPPVVAPDADEPGAAEPATDPFSGRPSITQTGAS